MDFENYRSQIHLDEPFEPPNPAPAHEAARADLMDDLIKFLRSEETNGPGITDEIRVLSSYPETRHLLRALLTRRGPHPLPLWFHEKLDQLLQREAFERGFVDAATLPRIAESIPGTTYDAAPHCALWRGDITTLRVDAVVNAANKELLGCFVPFHACIDNVIHAAAGPRVREDCHTIRQRQESLEGTGMAKVTRAYNLPSKYILHTVGPMIDVDKGVSPSQEGQLAACYRSCLDLASRISDARSVAFCCISTGVFGFPQEPAGAIALKAVEDWLKGHPDVLDLIVFNVFRQDDFEIYENLLKCG